MRLYLVFAAFVGMAMPISGRRTAAAVLQWVAAPGSAGGPCETQARLGGGATGCFWIASINLGPMPQQLYWHIDRFGDVASAEAARSIYGRVTVVLGGEVVLQTVTDNPGWTAAGGERLATIGPLTVSSGPDLVARFVETTTPAGAGVLASASSGPGALFVLEGALCVETPAGARYIAERESLIVPASVPSSRTARDPVRALGLVIHPADEDWTATAGGWTASGLCRP